MNERRRDDLRGWIAGEAERVLPPEGAEDRGWERLSAALAGGATPRADILRPPGRGWAPWVVIGVVLVGAALVGALGWPRGEDAEPVRNRDERVESVTVPEPLAREPEVVGAVEVVPEVEESAKVTPVEPVPSPARAVGRRRAPVPVPGDSFAVELRIIAAAQAALRAGDPRRALRELARHAREFPRGQFVQDREALQAVGLCRAGRGRAGARRAGEFLAAHPDSIHADRVREACGL